VKDPAEIYVVEPTGPIDDDPNLTDKKFPGNPTRRLKRLGIEAIED
jgi:rifampin ADP-ribosylating transferase